MKALQQLLPRLTGARTVGELPPSIRRVHTDTRSLQPGDLFVALKGERFDAHDFLPQAQAAGAVAAIAHAGLAAAGLPGAEVPDTATNDCAALMCDGNGNAVSVPDPDDCSGTCNAQGVCAL